MMFTLGILEGPGSSEPEIGSGCNGALRFDFRSAGKGPPKTIGIIKAPIPISSTDCPLALSVTHTLICCMQPRISPRSPRAWMELDHSSSASLRESGKMAFNRASLAFYLVLPLTNPMIFPTPLDKARDILIMAQFLRGSIRGSEADATLFQVRVLLPRSSLVSMMLSIWRLFYSPYISTITLFQSSQQKSGALHSTAHLW